VSDRFWLRPKWIFGHVLCLFLVVLFVNLGFWQLRRLDERRDRNERIESRTTAEPVALEEALADPDVAEFRRVEVTGRWVDDETVAVRSRALDERPGFHVVTPLVGDHGAVLVNRGFVPLGAGGEDAALAGVEAPGGTVTIEGLVRESETRGSFGPQDPDGELEVVNRIDVDRIQQQVDQPLAPVFVQLVAPEAEGGLPVVLPLPETSEGSHQAYAVQWFIFATVGAVGWPLLLRKTARDRREGRDPD
jgi:surfeit locus 1 family protein